MRVTCKLKLPVRDDPARLSFDSTLKEDSRLHQKWRLRRQVTSDGAAPGAARRSGHASVHVRGPEMEAAYAIARGCPMYHIDPEYDWGITGAMKCAHVVSAVRNTHFHELVPVARGVADLIPPVYACGYSEQVEAMDAGGTLPVPEGPGLRVACDWAYMERLALEQKVFAL